MATWLHGYEAAQREYEGTLVFARTLQISSQHELPSEEVKEILEQGRISIDGAISSE